MSDTTTEPMPTLHGDPIRSFNLSARNLSAVTSDAARLVGKSVESVAEHFPHTLEVRGEVVAGAASVEAPQLVHRDDVMRRAESAQQTEPQSMAQVTVFHHCFPHVLAAPVASVVANAEHSPDHVNLGSPSESGQN